MRKFQCFQNTRFLQLSVLFKLVKDEIPDEGRNAQMMRCRVRLNHRSRRDRCPSHDIFSRAVVPTRWSPPTWAVSFLSYHSFYIAYTGKKLKKAENDEQTFFWTNKYLKRTIVRYGLSPPPVLWFPSCPLGSFLRCLLEAADRKERTANRRSWENTVWPTLSLHEALWVPSSSCRSLPVFYLL